jgi:hypothetical protein
MSAFGKVQATRRRLRAIILIGTLALLTLLAGCSRVSLLYHTADIFIEAYADDYLALERMQLAGWRPALADALARHRHDELPYLARFFDTAHEGAEQGFGPGRVDCLLEQFDGLYRRHLRVAVDLAAPLLAGLAPGQVRHLQARFVEDNQDPPDNTPADVARRERKRSKRYAKSLEWWFGSVTKPQRTIVAEVTAAMPDTAMEWAAYRGVKQAGLIALLDRKADETEIRRYLDEWLVEFGDLPAGLRAARGEIREGIRELFLRMDASLSAKQRAYFAERLGTIRDDFMSLQKRPHMAAVECRSPA